MTTLAYTFLGLLILGALWYRLWFLRNPKIEIPQGRNIISPAHGKIAKIIEITPEKKAEIEKGKGRIKVWLDDVLEDSGWLISIVMTPMDIHFQKAPIEGIIQSIKHTSGKHKNAMSKTQDPNWHAQNEHQEIIIAGPEFKLKVIQIAGFIARRIVAIAQQDSTVTKGEDIGLIRLGSQVTLIIPKLKLKVKEGDKVKVGRTIIAEY